MLSGNELKIAVEECLYKASELLKIGWCRTWALDKEGKSVDPTDESACAWCEEGAIMAATKLLYDSETEQQVRQHALACVQLANKNIAKDLARKSNQIKAANNQALGATKIHPLSNIPKNNDAPQTTQEQVVKWTVNAYMMVKKGFVKFND